MEIRPEAPPDRRGIGAVHRLAFPTGVEARLVEALRAAGRLSISLVAVERGAVLGHVGFSPVSLESEPGRVFGLGLAPLAVVPDRQRRGIGSALVREGLEQCRGIRAPFVVVLGDPAYYRRFGFARARDRGIGNEYDVGDEFLYLELVPGGSPPGRGIVRYAKEFALVS